MHMNIYIMNVYIHTYVHIYTHIYIYFYIFVYVQILTKAQICTVFCGLCLSNKVTWSLKIPVGVSRSTSRATSALVSGLVSGNAFHRALVSTECEEKRWSHSGKEGVKACQIEETVSHVLLSRFLPWTESSTASFHLSRKAWADQDCSEVGDFGNLTASSECFAGRKSPSAPGDGSGEQSGPAPLCPDSLDWLEVEGNISN